MRSREDLDDLNTADSNRIEESMSLENPGVVGARLNTSCVGRPERGAADRLAGLEFAVASTLAFGRAGARAVDRYDCRTVRHDHVNGLPARQVALERQNPAILDDRDVEALALCAHINVNPHSHVSKNAPPRAARALAEHGGSDRREIALGAAAALRPNAMAGEVSGPSRCLQ
jgi:hypothetical protein